MARDIDSLLRQQAALATFGTFAFQETDLAEILNQAARICAESLRRSALQGVPLPVG